MLLKKITALTLISGFLMAGSANAQQAEKYLNVGTNSEGQSILLNTEEIEGTQFNLVTRYGSTIVKTGFYANCGDTQLTRTKMETYTESGEPLAEDNTRTEIKFNAKSPSGIGMTYVCRQEHARGW